MRAEPMGSRAVIALTSGLALCFCIAVAAGPAAAQPRVTNPPPQGQKPAGPTAQERQAAYALCYAMYGSSSRSFGNAVLRINMCVQEKLAQRR